MSKSETPFFNQQPIHAIYEENIICLYSGYDALLVQQHHRQGVGTDRKE